MKFQFVYFDPNQHIYTRIALLEWFMRQDEATDADMGEWASLKRIAGESQDPQLLYY